MRRLLHLTLAMLGVLLVAVLLQNGRVDAGKKTKVTWLGHASFRIETPRGRVLYIDPWLKNPQLPAAKAKVDRADFVLITHGHFDHVGEAVEILQRTNSQLVATFELGLVMINELGLPSDKATFATLMNPGGTITVADGEVDISMVPAVHGSGYQFKDAAGKEHILYTGPPVGYVVRIKNGTTIYHTGDTTLFGDMRLIGEFFRPEVMLINIGGHFNMEAPLAARATALVRPKVVIPMHFGTFPVIQQTTAAYEAALQQQGVKVRVRKLKPGETAEF